MAPARNRDAVEIPMGAGGIRPDALTVELLEAVEDGVAFFDANAVLVFCNSRYRELNSAIANLLVSGMAWEMLLRQAVQRSAISEETAGQLSQMETRLAEGAQTVPPVELETVSGDLHRVTLRQTSTGGFVVVHRDATPERRYAQEGQQADVLLQKVLEAYPANIVMSRIGDGQILYRSPAATELLGTSRCYYDHFASREERADFITALLPDGRVDDIRVTGLRADGNRFPCTISARVIEYRGEEVMVSDTVDITKEIALQKTLVEQREQLFQSEKMSALGELLAGVAHELNNPLSVVVGHALMMRDEAKDPDMVRRIEKIGSSAERCARIVKSFLEMARQQPTRLAPVDLKDSLETAIDALRQGATGLTSDVVLELPDSLPSLLADAHQIGQVFINLIANAEQAITESKTGGQIRVSARYEASTKFAEVRISDDGPGIPEDVKSRIFDPLFTTKEVGKGTGIGLAFCHRVVTSHNGRIYLETASGKGATFVIRLPVTTGADEGAGQSPERGKRMTNARVLLIEDEVDVAELVREILERDGFEVEHVCSAEAALTLLPGRNYALILTDLNMPGLGGREFYQRIARDHPALVSKIGFVTGDTMSPSARSFLESTKRPCLEKPLSPADLRRLARSLFEESRSGARR